MPKPRALFLRAANSCRPRTAEAIVNRRLGEAWEAVSAGKKTAGCVHPKAWAAPEEIGIRHTGRSKPADEFRDAAFDSAVGLRGHAAEDHPVRPGKGRRAHPGFPGPAQTDDMDDFRSVGDGIGRGIVRLIETHHDRRRLTWHKKPAHPDDFRPSIAT